MWLKKHATDMYKAVRILFKNKDFSVKSMGESPLISHMKGQTYQANTKAVNSLQTLSLNQKMLLSKQKLVLIALQPMVQCYKVK